MINLYWPVYKRLEEEMIELSNQIHFDDNQLSIYSIKIAELLIRCVVEIEAISKELYFRLGGKESKGRELYFDTECLDLCEKSWLLSKKVITISAANFYFQKDENKILKPLRNANKHGDKGCNWKKAYQAVKHNRTNDFKKANLKNLICSLGALFVLNIYYKDEIFNFEKDSKTTSFPINLGSGIFAIKLHKWFSYDGKYNYGKKEDFDECIYYSKYTDDTLEKRIQVTDKMRQQQTDLLKNHPKFLDYIKTNSLKDYKGKNFMWDILGEDDYITIINIASQELTQTIKESEYEAVLNKNNPK